MANDEFAGPLACLNGQVEMNARIELTLLVTLMEHQSGELLD